MKHLLLTAGVAAVVWLFPVALRWAAEVGRIAADARDQYDRDKARWA